MESIISKKSSVFYIGITLGTFLSALGILLVKLHFDGIFDKNNKKDLGFLFSLVIIAFGVYIVLIAFRKTYSIVINNKYIIIKGRPFAIQNIRNINFTGKQKFTFFGKKEGAEIIFNDGTTYYIYDNLYSNSAQLKYFLENAWLMKPQVEKQGLENQVDDIFSYYKGSIANFNLALASAFTLFVTYIAFQYDHNGREYFIMLIPLFFICLFSVRFYYFGVGKRFLTVRSFFFFSSKKNYKLKQIKEILLESNGKAPHSMTIIMQDYTKKKYYASSLYDSHWRNLKHDLENKGITVRDEIRLG